MLEHNHLPGLPKLRHIILSVSPVDQVSVVGEATTTSTYPSSHPCADCCFSNSGIPTPVSRLAPGIGAFAPFQTYSLYLQRRPFWLVSDIKKWKDFKMLTIFSNFNTLSRLSLRCGKLRSAVPPLQWFTACIRLAMVTHQQHEFSIDASGNVDRREEHRVECVHGAVVEVAMKLGFSAVCG